MRLARATAIGVAMLAFLLAGLAVTVGRPAGSGAARLLGRLFCRAMLRLVGVRLRVVGRARDGHAARLVVANHVSWLDPLVFGAIESFCPLAKSDVAAWPVISTFARLQGAVFVDRTRRMRIPRVNREMASRLAEGRSVLFFPEGTTFDGTRRGRFLTSHLACLAEPGGPGARVQPVAVAYSHPAAAWVGDATLLPHLWALLGRRTLVCTLTFGTVRPVPPGFDRKALGLHLAGAIEHLLQPDAAADAPMPRRANLAA